MSSLPRWQFPIKVSTIPPDFLRDTRNSQRSDDQYVPAAVFYNFISHSRQSPRGCDLVAGMVAESR